MKKARVWIAALLASVTLAFSACGQPAAEDLEHPVSAAPNQNDIRTIPSLPEETGTPEEDDALLASSDTTPLSSDTMQEASSDTMQVSPSSTVQTSSSDTEPQNGSGNQASQTPSLPEPAFSLSDVVPYTGQPYLVVNDNTPYFTQEDLVAQSYETYGELDNLGRCRAAYASIGTDLMPTEERGNIGQIKPTGWHLVKYDVVDGNYLYNRCHLIGYQLSGENANEKNLITGTRYLNVQGMLPFENMVADYVKESGNHVLYRVTPVFEGDNLLASGVLMEAESVEDEGESILFCVYVYNVQPGVVIDYATGDSSLDISVPETTTTPEPITPATEPIVSQENIPQGTTYILNTNTKKFHYPSCASVGQMKESNKEEYTGDRDDIISRGYAPCKKCNP